MAQSRVPAELENAIRSFNELRFAGVRIVTMDGPPPGAQQRRPPMGPRRERIRERVFQDRDRQRIEILNNDRPELIVIESPNRRIAFRPDGTEAMEWPPRREWSNRWLNEMALGIRSGRLTVTSAPGSRIAGVDSVQFTIQGPQGRVIQRLWIHAQTGMILKRESYGPGGNLAGGFEYESFRIVDSHPEALFRVDRPIRRFPPAMQQAESLTRAEELPLLGLPQQSGFRLTRAQLMVDRRQRAILFNYVHPQGPVSLIISRTSLDQDRLNRLAQGRLNVFSWNVGDLALVLIGERSETELARISRLVERLN